MSESKLIYQNYHKHTHYSNIFTPDSATTIDDYAQRCKALGHKTLCSMEHGFQGRYYETYEVAKKYGLKFVFGVEAYWVKDRHDKDRTNAHICLLAKNETGRRDINRVLSEANIDGYYYKPRLDLELLLSMNPDNVVVSTACIGYWQYDDIIEITKDLHAHFEDNFYLEVQYHNTPSQKVLNDKILRLSSQIGAKLIMGCDSHFIFPWDAKGRDDVLHAKGIFYEDEQGWYHDYPSGEIALKRFKKQGILTEEQALEAMQNTNIILDFEDIEFDKEIKLPTLYPGKTQKEKNKIYLNLLMKQWEEFSKEIPVEEHPKYKEEIKKEAKVIINTGMADYFLLDHEIVKEAVKMGGVITQTGRGSGVSYYTNTLLGFSKVDRIASPVRLYPERFISESRILQTKSLPDLDLNCGNPEVFALAQDKVLGEGHAYPMIAFGTFKVLSAFKMYAKSQNIDFDTANAITKQIEKYETDLKYASDDEKDLLDVLEYIDEKYHDIYKGCEKYMGIIASKSPHPCAYLIYDGNIKEELGLIRIKSESTGKDVLATVIDGGIAEDYKFLKNDLLKVDVVMLIDKVYKRLGMKPHTVNELMSVIKGDEKTWNIYKNGYTVGVNQVEKESTTEKAKRYQPVNISELTAFIAAIRPSFKSLYKIFENRESYKLGVERVDDIIKSNEMPFSFVIYQEQIMAMLEFAGFKTDETYGIIKAISKKKPDVVKPLEQRFIDGFVQKLAEDDSTSKEEALTVSQKIWTIIEDSSAYSFNASHAYSYALDSVYCAYLKAHYPLEFYETSLQMYSEKSKKDKVAKFKNEMGMAFDIKLGELLFGKDNRNFVAEGKDTINESMLSIKYLNKACTENLYQLGKKKYDSFLDLMIDMSETKALDSRQLNILVHLGYFKNFANGKKILTFIEYFKNIYNSKTIRHTKYEDDEMLQQLIIQHSDSTPKTFKNIDTKTILLKIWDKLENERIPISTQAMYEYENVGYLKLKYPNLSSNTLYVVEDINCRYSEHKPYLKLYNIKTGETIRTRIKKSDLYEDENKFGQFDVLRVKGFDNERKYKREDGKLKLSNETEPILNEYSIVSRLEVEKKTCKKE